MRILSGTGIALACLSTVLLAGQAAGQSSPMEHTPFDVSFIAMDEAQGGELRVAMNMLTDILEARGGRHNEREGWVFMVSLSDEDPAGNVALSIAILHRLPESIIELGKKNEAFYLRVSAEERAQFDPEGKHIREYMSEEYLRQFAQMQGHYVEIVQKAGLEDAMERIVDRFIEHHISHEN